MPVKLKDLISKVPENTATKVRATRDRARPAIQEALRAECRLVLRMPSETDSHRPAIQVPVSVSAGYPTSLEKIEFQDEASFLIFLSRYRPFFEQVNDGASELIDLRKKLTKWENISQKYRLSAAEFDKLRIDRVLHWTTYVLEHIGEFDPLKKVLSVHEDILGVYRCHAEKDSYQHHESSTLFSLDDDYSGNRADIQLYWAVIGLVSEWIGCSVENLTIVVLTHELAHAYTQLGADIEGRRWPLSSFRYADIDLKEGLAQYYTQRVLERLTSKYNGALEAFKKMLPKQSKPYNVHKQWIEDDFRPEEVRRAMLEIRRWNEGTIVDFQRRLKAAKKDLNKSTMDR